MKKPSAFIFFSVVICLFLLGWGVREQKPDYGTRYYKDQAIAIGYAIYGQIPVAPKNWEARTMEALAGHRPRRIPFPRYDQNPHGSAHDEPARLYAFSDDIGRAILLGLFFRVMNTVVMDLIFWLPFILAIPIFFWLGMEFYLSGNIRSGLLYFPLIGLSAFVSGIFSMSYSPVGFYGLCFFALLALSLYAFSSDEKPVSGTVIRVGVAGVVFCVCMMCRSGSIFLGPAFLFLLGLLSKSLAMQVRSPVLKAKKMRWIVSFLLLGCLFSAPTILANQWIRTQVEETQQNFNQPSTSFHHHPVWYGIWCGLGDFGSDRGYAFNDTVAIKRVYEEKGFSIARSIPGSYFITADIEKAFKEMVLEDIREHPFWFFGLLKKRIFHTLFQLKIKPSLILDGAFMTMEDDPLNMAIDSYYTMKDQADWFRLGRFTIEIPILLFIVPAWLFLLVPVLPVKRVRENHFRRQAQSLLLVMVSLLGLPVLITTGGAFETQAVILAYFLGAVFFVDFLIELRLSMRRKPPGNVLEQPV